MKKLLILIITALICFSFLASCNTEVTTEIKTREPFIPQDATQRSEGEPYYYDDLNFITDQLHKYNTIVGYHWLMNTFGTYTLEKITSRYVTDEMIMDVHAFTNGVDILKVCIYYKVTTQSSATIVDIFKGIAYQMNNEDVVVVCEVE